jgi:hypothetical protein
MGGPYRCSESIESLALADRIVGHPSLATLLGVSNAGYLANKAAPHS